LRPAGGRPPGLGAPADGARRPAADRDRRPLLRLSDQAAGVPGPLSRLVSPRRRDSRGADRPGRAPHPPGVVTLHRYRRLWSYASRYRLVLAASFAGAVVASALDGFTFALLIPFLRSLFHLSTAAAGTTRVEAVLDWIIHSLFGPVDTATALRQVGILILITVTLKNIATYVATYLGITVQERVATDLRADLYGHIQKLGLTFYQRTKG